MSRPLLILHIGSQKTGSTAIQSALDACPQSLAQSGLRFATSGRNHISHNRMWQAFVANRPRPPFLRLREEFKANPDHTHILSCEMFLRPEVAQVFTRFLSAPQRARTRVIVYLRRQDEYFEAMYKQHLKNGRFQGDVAAYRAFLGDRLAYAPILDAFDTAFGRENLTVVPYERAEFPGGNVVADFARRIGWHAPPADALGSGQTNASLALPYCQALGTLPDLTPPVRRHLIRALIADPSGKTLASNDCLTPEERTAMLAECADDNARTCATWTKGRTTLFSEPITTTAQPAISLDAARTHIETLLPTVRAALDTPT